MGLRVITFRIRQGFAKGLAWKCQEVAFGLLGGFLGTQGLAQRLAKEFFVINEGMASASVCQGIAQAVARALWLSPSGCSVANLFFLWFSFASFILSSATYNSICTSSFCVFDFMLTRFNSAWGLPKDWQGSALRLPRDAFGLPRDCSGIGKGLPWDCRGITERLPSNCLAITDALPPGLAKELLMANGLPVDCLGMQGCRLGVAQGYPWDCQ